MRQLAPVLVGITLFSAILVVIVWVFSTHWQEEGEDEEEKKKYIHYLRTPMMGTKTK